MTEAGSKQLPFVSAPGTPAAAVAEQNTPEETHAPAEQATPSAPTPATTAVVISMTAAALRMEMEAQGQSKIDAANAYVIDSQIAYDEAADRLVEIAEYKARVVALFKESKDLAHKTHASICEQERVLLRPAQAAEEIYKDKALAYTVEMKKLQEEIDRKNKEEQRRLEKERIDKARTDMITARKTAFAALVEERLRLADEAAANAASPEAIIDILRAPLTGLPPIPAGMSQAEQTSLQTFSDEMKLRLASKADEHKAPEAEVEEMIAEPAHEVAQPVVPVYIPPKSAIPAVAPPAKKVFEKSSALSTKSKYKAEVFDIRLLCRAIADGKVSPMYVEAAQGKLNAIANAERETLNIPGVRAVPDVGLSVNKARGRK